MAIAKHEALILELRAEEEAIRTRLEGMRLQTHELERAHARWLDAVGLTKTELARLEGDFEQRYREHLQLQTIVDTARGHLEKMRGVLSIKSSEP